MSIKRGRDAPLPAGDVGREKVAAELVGYVLGIVAQTQNVRFKLKAMNTLSGSRVKSTALSS